MKKFSLALLLIVLFAGSSFAQDAKAEADKQFMQVTTIESVVSGGMGRSKMIITNPDGSQKESELNNLFSLTGINFKNIQENEQKIMQTLKSFTDEGWKLVQTTPLSLSPGNNGQGIFMTRYLLSKPVVK